VVKAAENVHSSVHLLGEAAGHSQEWLHRIAHSGTFEVAGHAISFSGTVVEAKNRGLSSRDAVVDATAVRWAEEATKHGRAFGIDAKTIATADTAINLVGGMVQAVAGEHSTAGQVAGIVTSLTPSEVRKSMVVSTFDTYRALWQGDHDQAIRTHEQRLEGKYNAPWQGLAIAADAIAATVFGDQRGRDELLDAAAAGKIGAPANWGDRLGDAIFRWTHPNR
jgi:hypothetical protein